MSLECELMQINPSLFYRWASGNLVDNRNRGIFAEWLVGQILGVIDVGDVRKEWDSCDLRYQGMEIEVKTSGLSQTWKQMRNTTPRFSIEPQKQTWNASTDEWLLHDPPVRTSDVYIFCLHESDPATNQNVIDPNCWSFWVVSRDVIDRELAEQASLGLSTLNKISKKLKWSEVKSEIDQLQS